MSFEECARISDQCVKGHFKPKLPLKKEKEINPADLNFFINMFEANKRKFISREPPSAHDCQIIKSYEKKWKSRSSLSDVP